MVLRNTFSPLQLGPAAGAFARQTIHGMLEHWAAATPDAPAATFQVCPANCSLSALLNNRPFFNKQIGWQLHRHNTLGRSIFRCGKPLRSARRAIR